MSAGNPNWIAAGWGERTKAFKLPIRLANRIQEMRANGTTADEILQALAGEIPLAPYIGDWIAALHTGKIQVPPADRPIIENFLKALLTYWNQLP